jgi:ribosomal-protein-serine acetyltransferase
LTIIIKNINNNYYIRSFYYYTITMLKKFKQKLIWDRIILKRNKPTITIAKEIFNTVDNNREHIKPWLTREKDTKTIEDNLKYLFEEEKETILWKKVWYWIYLNNTYIGNIWIFNIDQDNKSAEIGYWLSKDFTRKWYITEAVKLVEKEFFENFNLNRIQIRYDKKNIASQWVAKKCWYKLEWEIREDFYDNYSNQYRNTIISSKLKSEYKKN